MINHSVRTYLILDEQLNPLAAAPGADQFIGLLPHPSDQRAFWAGEKPLVHTMKAQSVVLRLQPLAAVKQPTLSITARPTFIVDVQVKTLLIPLPIAIEKLLSPKQKKVCALLIQRCSKKEVASRLGISINTVHTHTQKVFKRLGVPLKEAITRDCLLYPTLDVKTVRPQC